MFVDNFLAFQGASGVGSWATPQTITNTADGTNVIDVDGTAWVTYSSQAGTPALVTSYGARNGGVDYGMPGDGEAVPWFYMTVTTGAGASANTVTPSISAAPDSATGTYPNETHAPGSYQTIWTGPAFTGTQLSVAGRFYFAPLPPALFVTDTTNPSLFTTTMPRFYKVTYTTSGGAATSLKVLSGLVINPSASLLATQRFSENFIAV